MSGYCRDVPYVFQVASLVEHFREYGKPTVAALGNALGRVDGNSGPSLLSSLAEEGLLTRWAVTRWIGDVWSGCEHPEAELDPDDWREFFCWAGYTVDGRRVALPVASLVLFRGAWREPLCCRYGMSWTDDREVALWFASRHVNKGAPAGAVWTAEVDPDRLYARNRNVRKGESEYVIETDGLDVTALDI